MSFQRLFSTVFLGSTLALGALAGGCVASSPAESEDVDEQAQALEPGGDPDIFIISLNSLSPGLLTDAVNQERMAGLATGSISTSTSLADTSDGRTLLAYIAVCALPEGTYATITGTDGTPWRFAGHIGLAPFWRVSGLSSTDERWISACLLAHANAFGASVEIELRGDHSALVPSGDPAFSEQEAAFYGDVFNAGDAFACIGSSSSDPEGTATRVCGRSTECKFTITGTCLPGSEQAVCAGGPAVYHGCETDDPEVTMDEVITVYTKPGTFGSDKTCSHPVTEEGWPLSVTCSADTQSVCASDPYCCEVEWDAACVDLAAKP